MHSEVEGILPKAPVVIQDYIRHIGGGLPFALDHTFAETKTWYRTNRISIEFDLLYRWHSIVPETFVVGGRPIDHLDFRFNNQLLEQEGVEQIITSASQQKAGRFGLFNTPGFLRDAEKLGLEKARNFKVDTFNRYRERFDMRPYDSIDDLADNPEIAEALKGVYAHVDDVEFTVASWPRSATATT